MPHVVTTTTHKTLRGPRGGMILANDAEIGQAHQLGRLPRPAGRPADACDRRQGGGPRRGLAAGLRRLRARRRRQCRRRSPRPSPRAGSRSSPAAPTRTCCWSICGRSGLTGRDAEQSLERAGITCNKNGIPFDPQPPTVTSGIRLGSPAATTRGFGPAEFRQVGRWIVEVLRGLAPSPATMARSRRGCAPRSRALCARFPIYPGEWAGRPGIAADRGGGECAVRSAAPMTPRSRIRGRPTIAARSGGGASARVARARFTTFERVQLRELTVVKKNGQREPFDRDKLARSIYVALRKRPVEPERVERMINSLVRQLESSGETEIPSDMIGELVMEALSSLDQVAYIRFASVYRNFREAKDFGEFVGRIAADGDC